MVDIFEENKKKEEIKNQPKKKSHGGLMERTLLELDKLDINLSDLFNISGMTLNLTWPKLVRLINYNANDKVLSLDSTYKETLQAIKNFLV